MSKLQGRFIEDATITASKLAAGAVLTQTTETFTLSSGDITAKYVALAHKPNVPGNMTALVAGQTSQINGPDFAYVAQAGPVPSISWNGLALANILVAGDILQVSYWY